MTFSDEIEARMNGNVIPFEPKPLAPEVSTGYLSPVDTPEGEMAKRPKPPPILLDDERQRRFREQFMPAMERAEPLPCGTPFLRNRPVEPIPPDLLTPRPKRMSWGGVGISTLSLALFGVSVTLNSTFWRSLATTSEAGIIMATVGGIVETINYVVPSAIAAVESRTWRVAAYGLVGATMLTAAIASTSFVRANLGADEARREYITKERARLQQIIEAPPPAQSSDGIIAAQEATATANANVKADCKRMWTDRCHDAKDAQKKAQEAQTTLATAHDTATENASTQDRKNREKAAAALAALPVQSGDANVLLAGVSAIIPRASEAVVNGIVAALWVVLFCAGPCVLLRVGLALKR
jgi:hypothetical protein